MAFVIAPVLVAVGVGATLAPILAEVITIAIGIGFQLLSSVLFKPAQPKPSDVQTILRQAAAPRFRSYGKVKVGGVLMFANTQGGAYGRVLAMGSGEIDGIEQHWIDDNRVDLAGDVVITPKYNYLGAPRAFIEFRLGTDTPEPYGALISAFPDLWTVDHLGRGIPSAFIVLHQVKSEQMGDIFPQYANTLYRQVQRGAKIRGVAFGALTPPEWSDNAARVILDYLTHPDGLRLDSTWIENAIGDWETAVYNCGYGVPVPDAEGGGYENRYRIWNVYRFDERPADVLSRFMQACDAVIYPTPNRGLAIKVGLWEEPTVTIDDDAIIGFTEFGRGRDILATANTITARYTSEPHDFLETDADPITDEADVAERGELANDIQLFAVPSHSQARRLMKIVLHRSNPDWVGRLTCNLRALPVMGERFINVIISELGISETFEVLGVQMMIDGTILKGVEIQIASLSSAAYDWDPLARTGGDAGIAPAVPPLIVSETVLPAPSGIVVEAA